MQSDRRNYLRIVLILKRTGTLWLINLCLIMSGCAVQVGNKHDSNVLGQKIREQFNHNARALHAEINRKDFLPLIG